MANFTACFPWPPLKTYIACSVDDTGRLCDPFVCAFTFWSSIIIAVLSPVAVAGNALILAAIWKKTFPRTPFHILLSGLAFTDLCTGLIAQPFVASKTLVFSANPGIAKEKPMLVLTIEAIGEVSATYSIAVTVFLITLMSVERWLHMSRRSLVTSRRGYFTVTALLLIPVPLVVLQYLDIVNENDGRELITTIVTMMLFCYLTTAFAYFKVYQVIRRHQHNVRVSKPAQNIGRPGIDLAKYKRSVATILYILSLFSLCFLPFVVSAGVYISIGPSSAVYVVSNVSLSLLFLSSSLNPGLYLWRMKDIRYGVQKVLCSHR